MNVAKKLYIAYAPEDETHKDTLERHLTVLNLKIWHSGKLLPGQEIAENIEKQLIQADIVLLLLSADFMASNYFDWQDRLLKMHRNNKLKVIPILLRDCLWKEAPIGVLAALPKDGKAVIQGNSLSDTRFKAVAVGIKNTLYGASTAIIGLPPLPRNIKRPKYPFMGLGWFTRDDARIFFGRGSEIKLLYEHVVEAAEPLVLLYGESGVGKSSLLHAGFLPRLEKTHDIHYIRRDVNIGLTTQLNSYLTTIKPQTPTLLIFDQVEEIYTNPLLNSENNHAIADEIKFFALVQEALDHHEQLQIILGFRKEYLAEIKQLLDDQDSDHVDVFLQTLSKKGVLEAIVGVANTPNLQRKYKLHFAEPELPYLMTDNICRDATSHIAPLLQLLLRNMWDEANTQNMTQRCFSLALYQKMKQNTLDKMLGHQLSKLKEQYPNAVTSGLILDVLYYYTTDMGTAAQRNYDELFDQYAHIDGILNIATTLKNLFLLSGPDTNTETVNLYARLAHDALAPLVVRRFNASDTAGQRAARILKSKRLDFEQGRKVELSKTDVQTIEAGLQGMRQLNAVEQQTLNDNKMRLAQMEKELEEKNRQLNISLNKVVKLQLKNVDQLLYELNYFAAHKKIITLIQTEVQYEAVLERSIRLVYWYLASQQYSKGIELLQNSLQKEKDTYQYSKALEILKKAKENILSKEVSHLLRIALKTVNVKLYDELHAQFCLKMKDLPGGTFWMGSPKEEKGRYERELLHEVQLTPFAIAETTITVFQYAQYCQISGLRKIEDCLDKKQSGRHPVVMINWYDAIEYCNWLSHQHGVAPAYHIDKENKNPNNPNNTSDVDNMAWTVHIIPNTKGYRLPTEAEWEYAARYGHLSERKLYAGSNEIDEVAWYLQNSENHTHMVKQKKPNAAGLYDMSGNVFEWCFDWFKKDAYKILPKNNPVYIETGIHRVLRGGSYPNRHRHCRVAYRDSHSPHYRHSYFGFRIVRSL